MPIFETIKRFVKSTLGIYDKMLTLRNLWSVSVWSADDILASIEIGSM